MTAALWAITPTALVGVLFWYTFRSVLRADRTERRVRKSVEQQEEARFAERYGALSDDDRQPTAAAHPASPADGSTQPGHPSDADDAASR
ncbi:hypothetical protein [Pseudoclavibacter sp. 13-3]|uniref:hypothetical protein n=1 Tax=Pseudoclavibacter sp. 13-3 TaxID=2901228 RepID=UPI001E31E666|nr:hypothetical protein [Pseudoclavibacter sp. 13-3]MCD7101491.1 hypothetical protein [Pseudoclavibacter sp. 13-3]